MTALQIAIFNTTADPAPAFTVDNFLVTDTVGTPVFVEVYLETSTDLQNWVPANEGIYDVSGTSRFFRAQILPQ